MGKEDETKQAARPSPGSLPLPVGSHRKAECFAYACEGRYEISGALHWLRRALQRRREGVSHARAHARR